MDINVSYMSVQKQVFLIELWNHLMKMFAEDMLGRNLLTSSHVLVIVQERVGFTEAGAKYV